MADAVHGWGVSLGLWLGVVSWPCEGAPCPNERLSARYLQSRLGVRSAKVISVERERAGEGTPKEAHRKPEAWRAVTVTWPLFRPLAREGRPLCASICRARSGAGHGTNHRRRSTPLCQVPAACAPLAGGGAAAALPWAAQRARPCRHAPSRSAICQLSALTQPPSRGMGLPCLGPAPWRQVLTPGCVCQERD